MFRGVPHEVVTVDKPVLSLVGEFQDRVAIVVQVLAARVPVQEEILPGWLEVLAEGDLVERLFEGNVRRPRGLAVVGALDRVFVDLPVERIHPETHAIFRGLGHDVLVVGVDPVGAADRVQVAEIARIPRVPEGIGEPGVRNGGAADHPRIPEACRPASVVADADQVVCIQANVAGFEEGHPILGQRVLDHVADGESKVAVRITLGLPACLLAAEGALRLLQEGVHEDAVVVAPEVATSPVESQEWEGGVVPDDRVVSFEVPIA